VVVDANKLIAAFLKNGLIRRIIVLSGIKLYTIEQVLEGAVLMVRHISGS